MKVSAYDEFVQRTDKAKNFDVALYGISGELGSVVSAVKRRLISGDDDWDKPNEEIIEELGDLIWYCTSAAQTSNGIKLNDIFRKNIINLQEKIKSSGKQAWEFGKTLNPKKRARFLKSTPDFIVLSQDMEFDDYQNIAFLTARTKGKKLVEICLAVLSRHCAELFHVKLPDFEHELNKGLENRPAEDVLGDIVWHIAAIASVYGLSLNGVVEANKKKVSRRHVRGEPTPLYDEDDHFPEAQRFPRRMTVNILSGPNNQEQMYINRRRLGDPLTDNARKDDGYRFHDVIHLAFVAKLGWSPVIRKLLGRKRKADPKTDEVEDGARAQIMEEALINAIHAEGVRQAKMRTPSNGNKNIRLFATREEISFQLLKVIENFVRENEVSESKYWEWEDAIYDGFAIFYELHERGQGTVTLDLARRTIEYQPLVHIGLSGPVAALGSAASDAETRDDPTGQRLIKRAIFDALSIQDACERDFELIDIGEIDGSEIAVTTRGRVRQAMWDQAIVEFRVTVAQSGRKHILCTAIGIGDTF